MGITRDARIRVGGMGSGTTTEYTPEFPGTSLGNVARKTLDSIRAATVEYNRILRDGNDYNLYHKSPQYYLGIIESLRGLLPVIYPDPKERLEIEKYLTHLIESDDEATN